MRGLLLCPCLVAGVYCPQSLYLIAITIFPEIICPIKLYFCLVLATFPGHSQIYLATVERRPGIKTMQNYVTDRKWWTWSVRNMDSVCRVLVINFIHFVCSGKSQLSNYANTCCPKISTQTQSMSYHIETTTHTIYCCSPCTTLEHNYRKYPVSFCILNLSSSQQLC